MSSPALTDATFLEALRYHLPVLQVVLPLLAAPVCLLIRHTQLVRVFALTSALLTFGVSAAIFALVYGGSEIRYALGGWEAPLGIELGIDSLNAPVLALISLVATVTLYFGPGGLGAQIKTKREYLLYSAYLLILGGLLGIVITADLFNVFVFLEISSLASYVLVGLGRGRRALMAAYSYLVVGTVGGTFVLLGVGLVYQLTGSLNFAEVAAQLPALLELRTARVALAFFVVGLSIKLAVFPLHQWLPNAYTYAPPVVSAFMAATSTKVAFYLMVRVIFDLFGADFTFGTLGLDRVLLPLAVLAMFAGSVAAIYQRDVRRLLAYSSIAQVGYLTLGLSLASVAGLTGGLVHLLNHALTKGGLFLAVGCIVQRLGSSRVEDLAGLGRRMPLMAAAWVVGGLSLIGVPGTAGFVSKWYLVLAALERGSWTLVFLIVGSSLLAVIYVWRVVEVAYFRPAREETLEQPIRRRYRVLPRSMVIATWVLISLTVVFGLWTELTADIAATAARDLLGVAAENSADLGGTP